MVNAEIDCMQLPEVGERMINDGLELAGGAPESFADVLHREIAKGQQIVTVSGIKPVMRERKSGRQPEMID